MIHQVEKPIERSPLRRKVTEEIVAEDNAIMMYNPMLNK